jgi:prepilin-type processing-associated H-X9-DG protein
MPNRLRRRWLLLVGALVAAVLLGSVFVKSRELSRRLVCGSNIKGFATAMMIYGGSILPSQRMEALIQAGQLQRSQTVCPATGRAYSFNSAILTTPVSRVDSPPTTIVAYEDPANHGGTGGTVVYGDGHATFESADNLARLLAEQGLAK